MRAAACSWQHAQLIACAPCLAWREHCAHVGQLHVQLPAVLNTQQSLTLSESVTAHVLLMTAQNKPPLWTCWPTAQLHVQLPAALTSCDLSLTGRFLQEKPLYWEDGHDLHIIPVQEGTLEWTDVDALLTRDVSDCKVRCPAKLSVSANLHPPW